MTYSPIYTTAALVQAKTGLSTEVSLSTDPNLQVIIEDAEQELEQLCARKFLNGSSMTEFITCRDVDVVGNYQTFIQLAHYPIQSISSFLLLDMDGNVTDTLANLTSVQIAAGTYDTADYWLDAKNDPLTNTSVPNGKVVLKVQNYPTGQNRVKIVYTYGYSAVPVAVRNLATCLAGMRLWITFLGGSYNYLNSYSIPEQAVNKGDFYQRGKQNIELLELEANRLLDRIGRHPRTMLSST